MFDVADRDWPLSVRGDAQMLGANADCVAAHFPGFLPGDEVHLGEPMKPATLSGGLPDVIMLDGPTMASVAWAGTIQPIGDLLDLAIIEDLPPAIKAQGT